MKQEQFSMHARLKSFGYALQGVRSFFSSQHNAIIHAFCTVSVILSGLLVGLNAVEWILISIVTGLVWITELLNTAVEKICDFISPRIDPRIKVIKDVAAAAVLVAAFIAVVTGLFIFIPRFL